VPPPVKVGACRTLAQLLPESDQDLIQPNVMGILSSLVDLLRQASDETLHLVLETLQSAIKSGGDQSTLIEPIISPIILDVWAQHIADPFISIDAIEVLEFLGHQECSWMLTATCVSNPPNNWIHFRET